MKPTTLELMKNVLAADETIIPDHALSIINQLETRPTTRLTRPGSIDEAAKILGVHPVTVRRYAKQGLLTPIRITARNVHYDLNEVEQLAHTGLSQEQKDG